MRERRSCRHESRWDDLDLFGERLRVPPEAVYAYVRATVDVGQQQFSVVLDGRVIDQHPFPFTIATVSDVVAHRGVSDVSAFNI